MEMAWMPRPKDKDWLNGYKNKTTIHAVYTPGRAAAMPAPAMIMRMPRPSASWANCSTSVGVRCKEIQPVHPKGNQS